MRILVLTPTFLPLVGGAELVLFEVYRRLAARHDVLLLTPVASPTLLRRHASAEYETVPFPVGRYADRVSFMRLRGHRLTAGAIPPFSLSAVAAVRRAVAHATPDVLNVHYTMPTGLAAVVADRVLGVPTVITINGRDAPGPGVPPLWRWWQRALLALVTDATYVSGYCQQAIYGAGPAPGQVVYNGVDIPAPTGDPASIRRALDIAPAEPMVLALQRLAPEKRVDVVLRAFRHCLDRTGRGVLVVAGTGPEAEPLRRLAGDLGIAGRVRFPGYVARDDVAGYFEAADVFAFHSTFETFGLVVAEAMSHGKPVVTVRSTALPEILGAGGLTVAPGDPRAFGEALVQVIEDGDLGRRLGAAGRQRATAHFAWDRIAEAYERVLARAAGRGAPTPTPMTLRPAAR